MGDIRTGTVISADGTVIGFDQSGRGVRRGGYAWSAVLAGHGGGGPDPGVRGLRHRSTHPGSAKPPRLICSATAIVLDVTGLDTRSRC
jgi:hypothetical protein